MVSASTSFYAADIVQVCGSNATIKEQLKLSELVREGRLGYETLPRGEEVINMICDLIRVSQEQDDKI